MSTSNIRKLVGIWGSAPDPMGEITTIPDSVAGGEVLAAHLKTPALLLTLQVLLIT